MRKGPENMVLISVIMPAYQTREHIGDSIESVLMQTFSNWELIIVDDGSTDDLADIVRTYANKDSRIRLICQDNQGVSVARNNGIKKAKGQYIAFLDSDDFYEKSFLERLVEKMEKEQLDFTYCSFRHRYSENSKKISYAPIENNNLLLTWVKQKKSIWIVSLLIRKKILNDFNIQFTKGCICGEDLEFMGKVFCHGSGAGIPDALCNYRYRPGSASQSVLGRNFYDGVQSRKRLIQYIESHYELGDKELILSYFCRELRRVWTKEAWRALKEKHWDAIEDFLVLHQKDPSLNYHFNIIEKCKYKIINSKNRKIWKVISLGYQLGLL